MNNSTNTQNVSLDVIRQAEMVAFFRDLNRIHRRVLTFRNRIDAGAVVEFGALSAEIAPGRPVPLATAACDEIEMYGMRLGPVESSNLVIARQAHPRRDSCL